MVFVYLPFYFAAGVILFFVWRWIAPAFKASSTLSWTSGAVPAILTAVFVIGLLGFAVGRATLPPSVFDLPVDSGRLWFAIPAAVVGAWAAAFFASASTRRKSAAEPADAGDGGAKGGDDEEWLRLDRSRALMVAAAALFLAFAALQYDYKLLGEVTKFSAGSLVSLELAQSPQKGAQGGSGTPNISGQDVAALPRTNAINYVTSQIASLSDSIEEDSGLATRITAETPETHGDIQIEELSDFLKGCGTSISQKLVKLQDEYNSEFPSIGGIQLIRNQKDSIQKANVQVPTSLLLRRLYDNINSMQGGHGDVAEFDRAVEDFADAVDVYEKEVDISLNSLGEKNNIIRSLGIIINDGDSCRNVQIKYIWHRMAINKMNNMSNMLGYLAALVAFSEFADGNRESAIRLIDKRIEDEIKNTHPIALATDLYLEARKRAMITRLIRWESNLVELVQTPERSPALDQIQFNRLLSGMRLHPFALIAEDPRKFVLDVLGAQTSSCPRKISLAGKNDIVLESDDKARGFYTSLYTEVMFMNNALDYVSKNGGVIRSSDWNLDGNLIEGARPKISQTALIRDMDLIAYRMLRISQSDPSIGREPVRCLADKGLGLPITQSTLSAFLETIGDYFEAKGQNFGSSAAPQTTEYEEAASGPVSQTKERIKALCYAIKMYDLAREKLNFSVPDDEISDQTQFGRMLLYYNHYNGMQILLSKASSVKRSLTDTYATGELNSYCSASSTYTEPTQPTSGPDN